MKFTESDLLRYWEMGSDYSPIEWANHVLAAAWPQRGFDALSQEPIGRRNIRLLFLLNGLFGPSHDAVAQCDYCSTTLEFTLDTCHLLNSGGAPTDIDALSADPVPPIEYSDEEYTVCMRLPSSPDLAAALKGEVRSFDRNLLMRCCVRAVKNGGEIPFESIPYHVLMHIEGSIEDADPYAVVRLETKCPQCGERIAPVVDIVSFLWTEIDRSAQTVLGQVHQLASIYGWHEHDILTMSPARRRWYLNAGGM
jgi:hypothetical protein